MNNELIKIKEELNITENDLRSIIEVAEKKKKIFSNFTIYFLKFLAIIICLALISFLGFKIGNIIGGFFAC